MSLGAVDELVERLVGVITITGGRRAGDRQTRVELDHLIPPPDAPQSTPARWRLRTSDARLYPPPVSREPLAAWHAADGGKGRRLLAADLAAEGRVAALLSWHFEPRRGRPHLVTSAAVRANVSDPVRAEYLVPLWLLLCASLAIDRLTVARGEIGIVIDSAIALSRSERDLLGLVRGSARGGYAGDYFVLRA